MYQVSDLCKQALKNFKRDLRFRIEINDILIDENDILEFTIKEGIISGDNFELGGAISSTFSCKINNLHHLYTNINFKGKSFKIYIGIVLSNGLTEYVPMGKFNIDEYKEDNNFISIEALDSMIEFEKEYVSKLTYPATAKAMLQEICSICKVELETKTFLNESYEIKTPIEKETCREIIHDISILAGGWAKINRGGKLELINITETDLEINKDNYIKLNVKEPFYVENFIVTETYFPIDAIPFNREVVPFSTEWQGNLSLDVGDSIRINDDSKSLKSIITKQTIKFNGGLSYESECTGLSEQQQNTQLVNQKKLNRRFASEIKQNADEILLRVTADGVETLVKQNADKWELSINGKLTGKTYTFDGESFTIGGGTGDIAKHTNSYSEWKFEDGSVARVDNLGFYNKFGNSRREYHHLSYNTEATVLTDQYDVFNATIQLPDEFKGKDFQIKLDYKNIENANGTNPQFFTKRKALWWTYKDINNARFGITGQLSAEGVALINTRGVDGNNYLVYFQKEDSLKMNPTINIVVTA